MNERVTWQQFDDILKKDMNYIGKMRRIYGNKHFGYDSVDLPWAHPNSKKVIGEIQMAVDTLYSKLGRLSDILDPEYDPNDDYHEDESHQRMLELAGIKSSGE